MLGVEEIINHAEKNVLPLSIRIVAAHNPVGCAYFSRYNGEGRDVNRDFKRLQSPETRTVVKAFEEFSPDFGITLHEGPQDGVFLYANKYCDDSIVKDILNELGNANIQLASKSYLRNTLAH